MPKNNNYQNLMFYNIFLLLSLIYLLPQIL